MIDRLRLYSGLVLFVFVTGHLLNHALGIVSLEAMNAGMDWSIEPWRTLPGTVLLAGAALIHLATSLWGLYERRTLRLPAWQWVQTGLGLLIPLLLVGHVFGTRISLEALGVEGDYALELAFFWTIRPDFGVLQAVMLLVVWTHGVLGIDAWLALKPWYARWRGVAYAGALLCPALALAGYVAAGMRVRELVRTEGWLDEVFRQTKAPPELLDFVLHWMTISQIVFVAVLAALFAARAMRAVRSARARVPRLTYAGGPGLDVSPGMSVLEALRAAGVPHPSVCGGRGRCSTCRVHVDAGGEDLPLPDEDERRVLGRISAPASVRLACQLRPTADVAITPLLPATATAADSIDRAHYQRSEETAVAVLFADMRGFTRLAEARLPYDVVFVLNRYRDEMARAIEGAGGVVNEFVGDGIMALFGLDGDIADGCRRALRAAQQMGERLSHLNETLAGELSEPLRIGIGIHAGSVIVGEMGYANLKGITVVGDVVNTASRLEEMTKELGAQLVISEDVVTRGQIESDAWQRREVAVRGRLEPMTVCVADLPGA